MSVLSPEQRDLLAGIADLLIPHADGMPSGSEAEAHGRYLDSVFAVRPDLVDTVRIALAAVRIPLPERLDASAMESIRPVADALTAAYFLNPDVAKRVGYQKRSVIPIRFDEDLDALTARVVARGPIYRPTPIPRSTPIPQPTPAPTRLPEED